MMNPIDYQVPTAPSRDRVLRPEPAQTFKSTAQDLLRARAPHLNLRCSLSERDESDPVRCAAELVQRGRLILDVSAADLEAAEATFGALHPTTWHFRNNLIEAQRSWEQLRAEVGTRILEAALELPALTSLTLGRSTNTGLEIVVILIGGQTYRPERVLGTELAPIQWRLTRLRPPLENGPYYICQLADGSTQCDCANWTFQISETEKVHTSRCKHVDALQSLGWV
jgi:hypothetical protein